MRHLSAILFLLLAATTALAQNHPVPSLNQPLSPSSTPPGSSTFTLTAHGAGFVSGATVNWNGRALATTFVNVDELTATVPANDIAVATSAAVTVTNPAPGGGTSNVVYFAVSTPTDLKFAASPSSTTLPLNVSVTGVVAVDLTRNGNLDLAVAAREDDSFTNMYDGWSVLGNGDGTFLSPTWSASGTGQFPVVGDFNGDGLPDLAETRCIIERPTTTISCELFVYLGNGDGTFSQSASIAPSNLSFGDPLVGDFNGDGKLDIAVATNTDNSGSQTGIIVFLGNGDGTFQSGLLSSISNMSSLNAAGDFDGDGTLDLIGTTATSTTAETNFFHGNGDGTFNAPLSSIAQGAGQILAADLNGDGKLDLIALQSQQNSGSTTYEFTVMLGNGDGTFQTPVTYPIGSISGSGTTISGILLDDFGSNGKLDVAYLENMNMAIVPGNGDGTFDPSKTAIVPGTSLLVVEGDYNNDGKLDLAVVYPGFGSVTPPTMSYLLQDAPLAGVSPTGLTFAPQPLGTTGSSQTITVTNNGVGSLSISNIAITGANSGDFLQSSNCLGSIAVGASCQINVSFTPTANGTRAASLAVTDDAPASPQTVALSGSGGLAAVQLSAPSIDFANEAVGNTSPAQTVTVTNAGYSVTNIRSISVTGTNASDFSETNTCGSSLAAGANCSISVTFTPAAMGARSAAVNIADDAPASPQTIALTGNGSGIVGVSPSTVTFSSQYVGTTGLPQSVTVTNNAATPLTISKVSTSPADFGSVNACGSTLAPDASCAIGVFFDPTAAGARTGTLTITDSATGSPQTVTLSGTGEDFSMTSSSPSATVSPGQTANYTVAIAPGGGFNQTVSFSCAGPPAWSTCSVSPHSLALSGSGSSSVTVSVATVASTAGLPQLYDLPPTSYWLAAWSFATVLAVLLSIVFAYSRKRPLAFACLLLVMAILSSCGGGGGSDGGNHGGTGTPAGTYTLTVTGTFNSGSTTLTHNTNLTLVVQ
jgi:FG-GAP-like repeat/Abnormal spindle-like microcephaly-assoc'd, ASPM-SPD-2-Hydin